MFFSPDDSAPPIAGQRLTLPAELEDGQIPQRIDSVARYTTLLLGLAVLWAIFAEMRELVVAPGEIIPSGRVQQIQHLEGGEVAGVTAVEGQMIKAGDALLQLRPLAATSDLNQLRVREASLEMQYRALTALIERKEPDFGELANQYPEIASAQLEVFNTKNAQLNQDRRALEARVRQKEAEIKALELEASSLERQQSIQREQLAIREDLLKDGYTSRRAYLTAKAALEEVMARHFATVGRLDATRQERVEALSTLQGRDAEAMKTLSEERSKVTAELAELREQIEKHRDRVDKLVVRSPIDGIVQELAQTAAGEVVKPGDLVAKVVPVDGRIVAEVRIDPKDIGHVKQGDRVEVRLSTFDPSIFGVAEGSVEVLSASTFLDENGQPYYKAVIELDSPYVGEGARRRMILPGMVVDANIVTGSKSLVRYLLAPVFRSLDSAFSER